MDFASALQTVLVLAVGAGGMYAYMKFKPNEKVSAAKDAAKSLAALAKVLGSDDSEDAKRAANELKLQLDKIRETADKLPEGA